MVADFPKTRQIDLRRFPAIPILKDVLSSAGFEDTRYYLVSAGIAKVSIEDYLDKTRKKFISTLALLSEEEFRKGFKIFEKKLREKRGNEVVYEKEYTFVVGERHRKVLRTC